jgi:hypothetical protein
MKAKERHRIQLIEFLGNPENEFYNRCNQATKILNFANSASLYRSFTPNELAEIEQEALEIRRRKYAPEIAKIDKAMLKKAQTGDPKAAQLCYRRFEGWSEKRKIEYAGLQDDPNPRVIVYLPENNRNSQRDEGSC